MDMIDFILNYKTKMRDGQEVNRDEFATLIGTFLTGSSISELLQISKGYKGEYYARFVELALDEGEFDIAMDIALANHDYKLCEKVGYEIIKVKENKKQGTINSASEWYQKKIHPKTFLDEITNGQEDPFNTQWGMKSNDDFSHMSFGDENVEFENYLASQHEDMKRAQGELKKLKEMIKKMFPGIDAEFFFFNPEEEA